MEYSRQFAVSPMIALIFGRGVCCREEVLRIEIVVSPMKRPDIKYLGGLGKMGGCPDYPRVSGWLCGPGGALGWSLWPFGLIRF